ncbi:MAG TPA: hypothetical protein VKQ07_09270 [Jatrophihabitantaceae bacterium]|nr:hypothetical protein [Jatrophihabitantaceae bacterium]
MITPTKQRAIAGSTAAAAVLGGEVAYLVVAHSGSAEHGVGAPAAASTAPAGVSGASTSVTATTPAGQVSAALCAHASNGLVAATTYIGAAESGVPTAQSCVYRTAVAASMTRAIAGKLYAPLTTDVRATVIEFASTDGVTRLEVTTAKESDGHFYVVGVTRA